MSEKLPKNRDKVIADTGWGIKPDDQPANKNESSAPTDIFQYDVNQPNVVAILLRAQRRGFNIANKIRIQPGKMIILDLNGDPFTVIGLSWGDPNLVEILMELGAAFDPQIVRELPRDCPDTREYGTGRVWAWGAERSGG